MRAPDDFVVDRMKATAAELRRRANFGVYGGKNEKADKRYLQRCMATEESAQTLLTYTRDADGYIEAMYPGRADGCLHVAMSPRPCGVEWPAPLCVEIMEAWLIVFFGQDALKTIWMEAPKTAFGKRFQVFHARRITRAWEPVEGILGIEFALQHGWLRAPELFALLRYAST